MIANSTDALFAASDDVVIPTPIPQPLRFTVALSGGGFRAVLFHLGVMKYLADRGLLEQITDITAVSGGAICGVDLVEHWESYLHDFDAAANGLLAFTRMDIRNRIVRRALVSSLVPGWGRTRYFESLIRLHLLRSDSTRPSPSHKARPRLHIVTTNLSQAETLTFTDDGPHSFISLGPRSFPTSLPLLERKVAMSSAFPLLFPPVELTPSDLGLTEKQVGAPILRFTDGGVFDNLGISVLRHMENIGSTNCDCVRCCY